MSTDLAVDLLLQSPQCVPCPRHEGELSKVHIQEQPQPVQGCGQREAVEGRGGETRLHDSVAP